MALGRIWIFWSGIFGAVGVAMGAFGGHVLRPILPLQVMTIFETAVRYHLFHTLALLGTAALMAQYPDKAGGLRYVAQLLVAGLVLFSGGLYGLSLTGMEWLAWGTPVGGICWIAAWIGMAWIFRPRRRSQ